MGQRVNLHGKLKLIKVLGVAKANLKRVNLVMRIRPETK
jgi:hypothetical protein